MRQVTKEDIDTIRTPWVWDLGNRILYDMCRDHPEHSQEGEIVAKVWLIGRSYAASIERCRNAKHIGDDFYKSVVAPTIRNQPIDLWLGSIQQTDKSGSAKTVTIHKKLTDLFYSITKLEKRSLASKYLHFHKPDFFSFMTAGLDSRSPRLFHDSKKLRNWKQTNSIPSTVTSSDAVSGFATISRRLSEQN